MKKKLSPMMLILAAAAVIAVLTGVYLGGRWLENMNRKPEKRGDLSESALLDDHAVTIDGVAYKPKSGIKTLLIMGIDKSTDAGVSGYRNGGQADFLTLLVLNPPEKEVTCLTIDRDTMAPITILSVLGKETGKRSAQICLSHGFGDGGKQSCELTVEAVSDLLLGVKIDDYIAMDLDGIGTLNGLAGGVRVTLEDDFSGLDPEMTAGTTLVLQGKQAEYYVRSRMNVGIGTNEARMKRQRIYIDSLTEKLREEMTNESFVAMLYDGLLPYLQSNMNRGLTINRIWSMRNYHMETIELPGTHEVGADGFMEFHADEKALQDTVLTLFYDKLN